VIKRRELIQHYLLQFMNQSCNTHAIAYLLPEQLYQYLAKLGILLIPKELIINTALVHIFKQKPEYEMIKQQEVFATMGL
jgi:hypothetical protein